MKYFKLSLAVPVLIAGFTLGCRTGDGTESAKATPANAAAMGLSSQLVPAALDRPAQNEPDAAIPQDPFRAGTPVVQDPKKKQKPRDIAERAFPPTLPDTKWHRDAWLQQDCMRCHETGVGDAPITVHEGMPEILLTAMCRSCHVLIPGSKPKAKKPANGQFEENAFPPMVPASASHKAAWLRDDCMLCHESGVRGAPKIVHKGMPVRLLEAKCRSCHVQVRVLEAERGK